MKFKASTGGDGGSYEKPKPGNYTGILIGIADIGTHVGQFGAKRKICLRWELHKRKGPSLDSAGFVHTIRAMYNQSFDVKSSLRAVIEAHIGKTKDGDELDAREWLGTAAKLVLQETDDKKYVNVATVAPLDPEEDEKPDQLEKDTFWEGPKDGPPPNWCKDMIERSTDLGAALAPAGAAKGAAADDDDDIPF